MLTKHLMAPAVLLMSFGQAPVALAQDVSPDFLVGVWSFQGKENCGVTGAEHIAFLEQGTFELGRKGTVDMVGFWELEDNRIDLHMVGSPYRFDDSLVQVKGQYGYAHLPVFTFDVEENAFDAVVPHEGEVRKRTAHRCP